MFGLFLIKIVDYQKYIMWTLFFFFFFGAESKCILLGSIQWIYINSFGKFNDEKEDTLAHCCV